jgi:hypothetical protein
MREAPFGPRPQHPRLQCPVASVSSVSCYTTLATKSRYRNLTQERSHVQYMLEREGTSAFVSLEVDCAHILDKDVQRLHAWLLEADVITQSL